MENQKRRQYSLVMILAAVISLAPVSTAVATTTSTSPHYSVTESQFGPGSNLQECSQSYCAKTSAGDTTVGRASSDNYSAQFGSNTSGDPVLEEIVTGGTQDMGVLDSTKTGTAVYGVSVRNYLSDGYVLQIAGSIPSQGTHTLKVPMGPDNSPFTSQPGAEQFGINLADNTAPNIGTSPVQVPSGTFSFGTVTSGYDTADLFKYVPNDIVASSTKSSGETDYTVSMIINVSNVTLGGRYNGSFSAVAVPRF